MKKKKIPPTHPGEILELEFLQPLHLSKYRLAKDINVPAQRIGEIVKGQRSISIDTALRFSRYFNTSREFWLGLQMQYDLDLAEDTYASIIENEVFPHQNQNTL